MLTEASLTHAFCRQRPKEGFGSVGFCLKLFAFLYLSIAELFCIFVCTSLFVFTAEPPQSCRVSEKISDLKTGRLGENESTAAELVVIRRGESDSDVVLHMFAWKKRQTTHLG